eukprot:EC790279.1.p2 GENE.EC790279.1~~EC790279.1.p2  ORF type:complete len:123 (+),score=51.69 EC790279.1:1-369(+)
MARRIRVGEENLIGIIGDEDTCTGFLLAGAGNVDARRKRNFFVVERDTPVGDIEEAFKDLTTRPDIAVVVVSQHVAETIRYLITEYDALIPTVLEIPSKEAPYDPNKDSIMKRVQVLLGFSQ